MGGKAKLRNLAKAALKVIASGAALYFVFVRIDLGEVAGILLAARPFFLLGALLFFVLSKWVSACRLRLLLGHGGMAVGVAPVARLYLTGMFYNLFLPGGIGGDGYKVVVLNRHGGLGTKKLIGLVLLDRGAGLAALVMMAFCFAPFIPELHTWRWAFPAAALCSAVVLWLFARMSFRPFLAALPRIAGQSFLVQTLQIVSVLCLLLAFGEQGDYMKYILVFLVSSVVAVVPLTIGGVGARELTFLYAAQWLGMDVHVSVTLSLSFYLITALVSLAGMYYVFFPAKVLKG